VDAVSVYLDASALVALFVVDAHNERANKVLRGLRRELIVSNLSAAEFSSVVGRRVRTRDLSTDEARAAFANVDTWCARHSRVVEIDHADFSGAIALMRRLDLPLRTPDALHISIAQRIGCALVTFDKALAEVARALDIELIKT
jgi:predicted nucleic acid-binding protein